MIQAMYSGIAGLKAFKSSLDVIGNNIANVNTVAYKAGRVTFKEALSQTMAGATAPTGTRGGTNPVQLGLGVTVGAIDSNMAGGSPQATGRQTDLMIEGGGYFVVSDGSRKVYTRDGSFSLDADNNLVSGTGMKVLGWQADLLTGAIDTSKEVTGNSGLNIPVGLLSTARATSQISIGGNLDDAAKVNDAWTMSSQVYDSLGLLHTLDIKFTRAANASGQGDHNEPVWNYEVTCPDATITGGGATNNGKGSIKFDANGQSETTSLKINVALKTPNGSKVPWDIDVSTSGISSISGDYSISQRNQDGLAFGTLESFTIGRDGIISGKFDNGSARALGQLALAQFTNPAGLSKQGNSTLCETTNSGSAQLGTAGGGSLGLISAGFLESSNVDLAQEFANMIIAQRGFQANSRIITTSDEVLQDLVSMKR